MIIDDMVRHKLMEMLVDISGTKQFQDKFTIIQSKCDKI